MNLPQPSVDALAHSVRLSQHIRNAINKAGGWIPFSAYMELALYAPGLGYYSAGASKLGREGDFVTAPELSPLFGKVLARQVGSLFQNLAPALLEVGAGAGALAASLLEELQHLGALPDQYFILELSADLRQRERDTLAARVPHLLERVTWLDRLPTSFSGVVIGNEVLDAMPVEVFRIAADKIEQTVEQAGVAIKGDAFDWSFRTAPDALSNTVGTLGLAAGYRSEVALAAPAFIASLAKIMEKGVALFIDYGFPRHEYYHPQRSEGTLMCHYRHRAHDNPFFLPGLQDITAHVDFSAIAGAAAANGLDVLGYATQAQFLINCGITDVLAAHASENAGAPSAGYLTLTNGAQRLLSPAEMGELFKVIALGRGMDATLPEFSSGDKTHTL